MAAKAAYRGFVAMCGSEPGGRCVWARNDLAIQYHDTEWGVPRFDDAGLFEFLILEGAQAGLSWDTILRKRERYREVYCGFDAARIARFTSKDQARLLADPGIVRNKLKVAASVTNARAFLNIQQEGVSEGGGALMPKEAGPFGRYMWSFVQYAPIQNRFAAHKDIPASTAESDAMSKDLKKRGFKFVGSTICYALMQATGMVNDHVISCPRHRACAELAARTSRFRTGSRS